MAARNKIDMMDRRLPDFLCIGAQRSGTSWLNKNLDFHPEVWLTPIKELHYFDEGFLPFSNRRYRFLRHMRRRSFRIVRQFVTLDKAIFRDLQWDADYFLNERNDNWYKKLFRPDNGQIAGEVTPAYATLGIEKIKKVYEINSELKIIYLLRDPINRGWSDATRDIARRKKRLSEIPDEEIINKLTSSDIMLRSDYLRSIERWEKVFGPGQIFIDFFERIVEEPRELLYDIQGFLGITASEEFVSPGIYEKINQAGNYKSPIPLKFQILLAEQQIDQLRELNKRFSGPTNEWLKRAEQILAKADNKPGPSSSST